MNYDFRSRRNPHYKDILDCIKAYDKTGDQRVVHIQLDDGKVLLLNQLKLATGLEMQKMVAFAVSGADQAASRTKNYC